MLLRRGIGLSLRLVGCLLIFLAFTVLLHQYVLFGRWWDMSQFLHHENIAAVLAALGAGMLIRWKAEARG